MRLVVVDCTPYGPGASGARRRAEALLRRLPALLPDDVLEVHWARDGGGPPADLAAPNLAHAVVDVSCRGGARRWWQRGRDLARRHRDAPYTHLLSDHGPVVAPERVRNLVTLHDLRFLHGYGGPARAVYGRLLYGRVLRRAAAVIAVSPAVAAEAAARYRLEAARLVVAPNAPDASFRRPPVGTARAGALLVARDEPRKACGAAHAAAAEARLELHVVEGACGEVELGRLYGAARWLLAPSLLEGYDLPVAEALACGTPVVASDIPAHRDLLAAGARGLRLVAPPRRARGAWTWPEAVAVLRGAPPAEVAPPAHTWDAAARAVADAVRA